MGAGLNQCTVSPQPPRQASVLCLTGVGSWGWVSMSGGIMEGAGEAVRFDTQLSPWPSDQLQWYKREGRRDS